MHKITAKKTRNAFQRKQNCGVQLFISSRKQWRFSFPFLFFLSFLQKLADDKGQQQATEWGHTTLTSNLFCVEGEVPRYTL